MTTTSERAGALGPGLLAVFLITIACAVIAAPMDEGVTGILIKVFVATVMGGIGVGLSVIAVRTATGQDDRAPGVPAILQTFCPACGEGSAPNAASCGRCSHPFLGRIERWKTDPTSLPMLAFLAALGVGIGCLGIALMVQPMLDGAVVWAALGLGALGLLLALVGAGFVYGAVLMLLDRLRATQKWTYAYARKAQGRIDEATATAVLRRGAVVKADGRREAVHALVASNASMPRLTAAQTNFVHALMALWEAGLAAVLTQETETWRSAGRGVERTADAQLCAGATEGPVPTELRIAYEVIAPRARSALGLLALWRSVRDDEAATAALAEWARGSSSTLREEGLSVVLARALAPSVVN